MIRSVALTAWLVLVAPVSPHVGLAEEAPPAPAASEERYEELLARFDAAVVAVAEEPVTDDVSVLEAETIAWVAAELLEEGEPSIAADLLAEALALLDPSFSPPDSSQR